MSEIKLTPEEENIYSEDISDEPPPVLKSWKNLYWLVFGNLVLLIVIFYIFTKVFE